MMKRVGVRFIVALCLAPLLAVHLACAPRLEEQQVRTRLVKQVQLQNDLLKVGSITRDTLPVASIDYGGARANVRFRYQDSVWVIDAVERKGTWVPADRAVPGLAAELTAEARVRQTAEMMPRYARTLKLLVGWSALLSADCSEGLPLSQTALLNLHATWHRALFENKGTEFHSADLFLRDAWWKPLRLKFSATRTDVQSSGWDRVMDSPDDVRLVYTRSPVRAGINVCMPYFTMPAFAAEAIGRPDAPAASNSSDLMLALKRSGRLELVADR